MAAVTMRRELDGDPPAVRDAIADTEAFMRAGGFDGVDVSGDRIVLTNHVGLLPIELTLAVVDEADAVFAYRQVEGIFEEMETRFSLEATADGVAVTARTTFALDRTFVGPLLDATVVKRQRRRELDGQFDYLSARATASPADP